MEKKLQVMGNKAERKKDKSILIIGRKNYKQSLKKTRLSIVVQTLS